MSKHRHRYLLSLLLLLTVSASTVHAQRSQACTDTSYRMRFFSPGKDLRFSTHCNTADGGTVLAGNGSDTGTAANNRVVFLKLNATGGLIWATSFQQLAGSDAYFARLLELSNGEVIAFGVARRVSAGTGEIVLLKFSANGTLLWSNSYLLDGRFAPADRLHPFFLSEGINRDLLVTIGGTHEQQNADSTYAVMARIDQAGKVLWSRALSNGPGSYGTSPSGIYEKNGELLAFGYVDNTAGECGPYTVIAYGLKLRYATGELLQTKAYCHAYPVSNVLEQGGSPEKDLYNSTSLLDGRFALFGRLQTVTDRRYGYKLVFDDQVNLVKARLYDVPKQDASPLARLWVLPDGTTHFFYLGGNGTTKQFYWASLGAGENILRERKLVVDRTGTGFGGYLNFGYRPGERYNFSTAYRTSGQRYSLFTQLQPTDPGLDSCLGGDTAFLATRPLEWSPATWRWKSEVDGPLRAAPLVLQAADFTVNTEPLCTEISRCDSLRISGPDTVCVANGFVVFTGEKNAECRKRVLWELNGALVDSAYQPNDSTLCVRFPSSLQTVQTLAIQASAAHCTVAKDTAQLVLVPALHPLPNDTLLCEPFSLRLTPGSWGRRYRWQDGSTDSVLTATAPGRYVVQVETRCGTFFNDTVNVAVARLSAGPDKVKCNNDSVVLRATGGFKNYRWQPQQELLLLSDSVARVFPGDTTRYVVSAETSNGCVVSDTVRINVLHSPRLDLGHDTTFCEGESLTLQAPLSFADYQWSDGSTTPAFTVKQSGTYWVKATARNGCSSTDSLTVRPLYRRPVVSIVPKGTLCTGQSDTLRLGGNFLAYRWSDGTNKPFLPVSDLGTYWVRVSDSNGCSGSDTSVITKLAVPPRAFLPADTAVCRGATVELMPTRPFQRYRWSTGSSSPSIAVSNAGLYALQVYDNANCFGIDSITVAETVCPRQLLFPSAFTPNGDGRNDVFKPFVQGQLIAYAFTLYNRWGQVVFSSDDCRTGWNGRLRDLPQETGSFVWLCQYRFAGETKKFMRGTVTLIR